MKQEIIKNKKEVLKMIRDTIRKITRGQFYIGSCGLREEPKSLEEIRKNYLIDFFGKMSDNWWFESPNDFGLWIEKLKIGKILVNNKDAFYILIEQSDENRKILLDLKKKISSLMEEASPKESIFHFNYVPWQFDFDINIPINAWCIEENDFIIWCEVQQKEKYNRFFELLTELYKIEATLHKMYFSNWKYLLLGLFPYEIRVSSIEELSLNT